MRARRLLLAATIAVAGCRSNGSSSAGGAPSPGDDPTAAATAKGEVPMLDAEAMKALFARSRGRVLVVNFWASWCMPCVMEFGELDQFTRAYQPKGVDVIAIALDDPKLGSAPVKSFITARRPAFKVVMRGPGAFAPVLAVLDPKWGGSIPSTFVLDREGKLQARLIGAQRRSTFEQAVAPLLGGTGAAPSAP